LSWYNIRQSARGGGQPEQWHQLAKNRRRQLFVGAVDATGGQPTRAFAGMVLGHHGNDPISGEDRSP
jgi:hypothetical protein